MNQEQLWRAALHDLNNAFGGLRGILDLNPDPAKPLKERDRQRMEAVVSEGLHLVATARGLVLGLNPEVQPLEAGAFREALETRLAPMSSLHRCPVQLDIEGEGWPAPTFVGFAAAVCRQLMPLVAPDPLQLTARSTPEAWILRWGPLDAIPESLLEGEDRHRDLAAHLALSVLAARRGCFTLEEGALVATLSRG
ncbi:MAG TPA: hypothetical protein VJ570_10955 [Holophagaceae bacterium]|nr:hypothetical protein [Holophagaceae bacterium]